MESGSLSTKGQPTVSPYENFYVKSEIKLQEKQEET